MSVAKHSMICFSFFVNLNVLSHLEPRNCLFNAVFVMLKQKQKKCPVELSDYK